MSTVPRSHVAALAAAIAVGMLLYWMGWPDPQRPFQFAALLVAAILAALPAAQPAASTDWPVLRPAFVVEFATLLLFGPLPMLLVATAATLTRGVTDPVESQPPRRMLMKAAMIVLSLQAAAWAHRLLGGSVGHFAWPWQAAPIAAAVVAYCFAASVFSDAVAPFITRRGINPAWLTVVAAGAPVHFIAASVAVGVAELATYRAWHLLPVAAVPAYLAFRLYRDYLIRIEDDPRRDELIESLSHDVAEQNRAIEALKRYRDRLRLAAEGANDALWEWNLSTHEFYVTTRWKAMLGLAPTADIVKPEGWFDRVHADDVASLKAALDMHLSGKSDCFQHEHRIRHEDGTYRTFRCRGVAAKRDGQRPTRIAGSFTDTTDLAMTQERLRDAVFLDPLTGLSNRAVFVEGLGRRLKEFQQRPGANRFALLYLDLDRFKVVNDSLGHLVGDELLIAVSRRLESCLRQGDVLARLGGDEFAILLNGLHSEQQANVVAFRVQEALSKPFSIGGREVFTSASIGIAFGMPQYTSPDEIMHDADTAMYHAKTRGKARHEVFDADMDARARDRLGLENDLRRAVNNNDFEVHYQPIVSLSTGMCVGFESLVRWTRNGKPVSPTMFIPIAEELGLIEPLGTRVLQEACRTFAQWKRKFPNAGLDYITVNVSSRQLMQDNFLSIVERAVHQSGLQPCDLRIEITETALMTSPRVAADVLGKLRDFGAKIYLDDFGTGYSSLSHLHKLPVDALKIDRSFVRSLLLPDRPAIVESILALARTLNTSVVAEGIETDVQARELERLGCTHAQGFLFSRAVSIEAVEHILLTQRPLGPKGAALSDRQPAALTAGAA